MNDCGGTRFDPCMATDAPAEQVLGSRPRERPALARIAAAVDCHPEGRDAAVLAAAIAKATASELLLITIENELALALPGIDRRKTPAEREAILAQTRDELAFPATTAIHSDRSVPRGIERVARATARDAVCVGSSRNAEVGQVAIGRCTRQLLHELDCALAIAPRALAQRGKLDLRRIAVGYDGSPEAQAALVIGAQIAAGSGARLVVRGVVDDRMPPLGWQRARLDPLMTSWRELMDKEVARLRAQLEHAAATLAIDAELDIHQERPATSLLALSGEVDLLVIGSRRWGPLVRALPGGTGEALAHGARCSLLVVPRSER